MKFNINPKLIDLPPNQILQINATVIAGAFIFLTLISNTSNIDRFVDSVDRYREILTDFQNINPGSSELLNDTLELERGVQKAQDSAYQASVASTSTSIIIAVGIIIWFSISSGYTLIGNNPTGLRWMWSGFIILIAAGIALLAVNAFNIFQGIYHAITTV